MGTYDSYPYPSLSVEGLAKMIGELLRWRVYYLVTPYCPKTNDGQPIMYKLPMSGHVSRRARVDVFVMHPDVLPLFIERAEEAGLTPVQFKWDPSAVFPEPDAYRELGVAG